MDSNGKLLLFILFLPFLAAIGHDVYINYFSAPEKIEQIQALKLPPEPFQFSDAGWVWQTYAPRNLEQIRNYTAPEQWTAHIYPVLQTPLSLVTLVPFGLGVLFSAIAFLLGVWPFEGRVILGRKKDTGNTIYKHADVKKTKYSRK